MANVVPCEGNDELDGAKGAYVKVVAPAVSESEFREKVASAFLSDNFLIKNLEEIETFSHFAEKHSATEDIKELAEQAEGSGSVVFDTFHTYDHDETLN